MFKVKLNFFNKLDLEIAVGLNKIDKYKKIITFQEPSDKKRNSLLSEENGLLGAKKKLSVVFSFHLPTGHAAFPESGRKCGVLTEGQK